MQNPTPAPSTSPVSSKVTSVTSTPGGFLDISKDDLNIKFFFTMLRNYIACASLMGVGDIYLKTEALHVLDFIVFAEWINILLGGSIMATGFILCFINVYQSYLVFKGIGINRLLAALAVGYLSVAGLIVIIGVERRLLTALQLVVK